MNFWNRRNKIEFFNREVSIIDNFPIIECKNLKLNWVKRAREDFQNNIKPTADTKPGFSHVSRCPGIFDLFKYGYVIPLHKDILIHPKKTFFEYRFNTVSSGSDFDLGCTGSSSESNINLVPTPPWAANFIIKIETGWNVIAPKGIKFIMLPIAYPDTFDFTAATGILNPALTTQINFQMFWNETEKEEVVVRAGTPLGHLIPLSEKKYQMVQRVMNQRDHMWVAKFTAAYDSTFSRLPMRGKVVNMYNKNWKR